MNSSMNIYYHQHLGPKTHQEDSFSVRIKNNRLLLIVADGMGGHSRGDIASKEVTKSFEKEFENNNMLSPKDILKNALLKAHERLKEINLNMGSTVVAAIIEKREKEYTLTYTWVGDSRLYIFTPQPHKPNEKAIGLPEEGLGEKKLWLLTRDDSTVWDLYSKGELSLDQIAEHPSKNYLQNSVHPSSEFPIRIEEADLQEEDKLLLCTDGTWESFPNHKTLSNAFAKRNTKDINYYLKEMIKSAIKNGRCDDNNTFILLSVNSEIFKASKYQLEIPKTIQLRFLRKIFIPIVSILLFVWFLLLLVNTNETKFQKTEKFSVRYIFYPKEIKDKNLKENIKIVRKDKKEFKYYEKLPPGKYKIFIENLEYAEFEVKNKHEEIKICICQVSINNPLKANIRYSESKKEVKNGVSYFPLKGLLEFENNSPYVFNVKGKNLKKYDLKECVKDGEVEILVAREEIKKREKEKIKQTNNVGKLQVVSEGLKISNSFIYDINEKIEAKNAIKFEGFNPDYFILSIGNSEVNSALKDFKLVLGRGDTKIEIQRRGDEKPKLYISNLPSNAEINIINKGKYERKERKREFKFDENIDKIEININP